MRRWFGRVASTRLLRALLDAGWPVSVLVEPMGRTDGTIRRRVARQPAPTGPAGVEIPFPPRLPRRVDRAVVPLDQRQWLRPVEAAELMAVHTDTVSRWRLAGLLPHTIRRANNTHLFSRADLLVVVELRAGRGNVPIQKVRARPR